jgi:hypothetical protein
MGPSTRVSTGIDGLDKIIDGLRMGDNVVWQIENINDYKRLARAFVERSLKDKRRVVYMRFGHHEPLFSSRSGLKIYTLNPNDGFEGFSGEVNKIVTEEGRDVFYVFDSLSDLLSSWATDLMIGNFFFITCPYLFDLNTVAYFALLQNRHSHHTVARIRETTQLLMDVRSSGKDFYVHPLKVWKRYSPTMFLPHMMEGEKFLPITRSLDASRLLSQISGRWEENARRHLDYWDRLFMQAEEMLSRDVNPEEKKEMIDQLCRIMLVREPQMLDLAQEHFTLDDLLKIKSRLIGTGYIGGKTVGMLLSRKILTKDTRIGFEQYFEPHDSFYIGSDVFYTYIVQNGWWKLRMEQKTKEGYFEVASQLKVKLADGIFPDEIKEQFQQIIEYFGQSPMIIRSSSLLEDSFGHAFAGKYESFFCANQGSPEERYIQFEDTVRKVYASTMNEDALIYRKQRGLEELDEQMALLVQRVSGSYRKDYFFPDLAGVGMSYNTFVWNKGMDPAAGMLRLVLGLGTRAVNRVEKDYPRMVALDEPLMRPHAGMKDLRTYSQRNVDLINLRENEFQSVSLLKIFEERLDIPFEKIASADYEMTEQLRKTRGEDIESWLITFDNLLTDTSFVKVMQGLLKNLENAYSYPLEIEFTVNFNEVGDFRINLLQCRPLQVIGVEKSIVFPENIDRKDVLLNMNSNFMGGSISQAIKRVIFIQPEAYSALAQQGKYEVARIIGELNRMIETKGDMPTMLLGPGRWGTTTPALGVPVHFSEINNIAVLGEIAHLDGNLMPELSYGTHFFQDLVESRIFYLAIFPEEEEVFFNPRELLKGKNLLAKLLPDYKKYKDVVKVFDVTSPRLNVISDVIAQRIICFFQKK